MNLTSRIKRLFGRQLTCQDANSFLASYLDGALDEKTANRFAAHLGKCRTCSDYLDKYRTTVNLCKSSRVDEVPPELVNETLEFLRKNF